MIRLKNIVLAATLLLGYAVTANAATLTSKVDRQSISANETLELTVSYSGASPSQAVDFSALEKHFEILAGPSHQSSFNVIVNGDISASHSWAVTLFPKTTGTLTIPAFELDGVASEPIDVTVTEPAKSIDANSDSPVFLEMELDKESLYVQEQLQITYRFYHDIPIYDPKHRWPDINAELFATEPVSYRKLINGRTFNVIEWRRMVFPSASGTLEIEPFRVSAYTPRSRLYPSGKRFNLFSDRAEIEVKPRPANSGDPWLPARGFGLSEKSLDPNTTWRVGEPLTREITLSGYGVTSTQLPELTFAESDSYRLYPDRPKLDQGADAGGVISTRTESIAIVPTRPGPLTLPPAQVQWWDTTEQRLKTAELPAKTFEVLPALNETYTPSLPTPVTAPVAITEQRNSPLLMISLVINLVLIAAIVVLLLAYRRRPVATTTDNEPAHADNNTEKQLFSAVRSSAKNGDKKQLREALLKWAQRYWQHHSITTLDQLGSLVGEQQLHQQLNALDQSLYGREEVEVDIQWIASELKRYRANGQLMTGQQKNEDLQPLYPT